MIEGGGESDRKTPLPGSSSPKRKASLEEQLFDDLSLPEPPKEPPRTAKHPTPIPASPLNLEGVSRSIEKVQTPTTVWQVRTDSGQIKRFDGVGALQAWLKTQSGTEGYQVSRDNVTWRNVSTLSDFFATAAPPAVADLGSKPLIAPGVPRPVAGSTASLAGSTVPRLRKKPPNRSSTRAGVLLGVIVTLVALAHALHFANILDVSSVFPWLNSRRVKERPRPLVARVTGANEARAQQPVVARNVRGTSNDVPVGSPVRADAGAEPPNDGGVISTASKQDNAGELPRTSPPELPIPKDPHDAYEAAKKLAGIKQWPDVVRYLEFAKETIHNHRGLLKLLAKAYDATGRRREAARINEKYRRQDLLARANGFLKSNPQRALIEFRELQEMYKNMAEAYFGEARAQKALGNEEAAKKAMDKYRALSR